MLLATAVVSVEKFPLASTTIFKLIKVFKLINQMYEYKPAVGVQFSHA